MANCLLGHGILEKAMITILLGGDTIAKQKYIQNAVSEDNLEKRKYKSGETLPSFSSLGEPTLFGPKQAYVFEYLWKEYDVEKLLTECAESNAQIFIVEDSIDKRKTINKTFLLDSRVTVKDFEAPSAVTAEKWIVKHAKELGVSIEPAAAQSLAGALLANETSKLSVELAHNELQKLQAYAGGRPITQGMVNDLVQPVITIDAFALLNAIGTKNKSRAIRMLADFFEHNDGDMKTKAIQVGALLADQLRNILLVLDAEQRHMPEPVILEKTGWNSKRLFVIKKLAKNFTPVQVKQSMVKMENLDMELKSSTLPPHLILDMIISTM